MTLLETIAVAFSMFSALPIPQPVWNKKNMRYTLCAFPLIGIVIGLFCAIWAFIAAKLSLSNLLCSAGYCLIPIFVTGGIHLDGYADTSDALSSYSSPEKRQEILKDPHCGAFAVIRLLVYCIAYLALCTEFTASPQSLLCMGCLFVLSRTLSGIALTCFPMAKNTGLAHTFATAADKQHVRILLMLLAALTAAVLLLAGRITGLLMLLMAAVIFGRYRVIAIRDFGGISGDLAGWFLQKAELWMLAVLVIYPLVEKIL